jgi:peptidyl-prolyl cis-trans isomerase SurA
VAEFKAKVVASGSTFERYKQLLRDDVVLSRYREREVEAKIKISDAEIDNFIAERTRAIGVPHRVPLQLVRESLKRLMWHKFLFP